MEGIMYYGDMIGVQSRPLSFEELRNAVKLKLGMEETFPNSWKKFLKSVKSNFTTPSINKVETTKNRFNDIQKPTVTQEPVVQPSSVVVPQANKNEYDLSSMEKSKSKPSIVARMIIATDSFFKSLVNSEKNRDFIIEEKATPVVAQEPQTTVESKEDKTEFKLEPISPVFNEDVPTFNEKAPIDQMQVVQPIKEEIPEVSVEATVPTQEVTTETGTPIELGPIVESVVSVPTEVELNNEVPKNDIVAKPEVPELTETDVVSRVRNAMMQNNNLQKGITSLKLTVDNQNNTIAQQAAEIAELKKEIKQSTIEKKDMVQQIEQYRNNFDQLKAASARKDEEHARELKIREEQHRLAIEKAIKEETMRHVGFFKDLAAIVDTDQSSSKSLGKAA